MKFAKENRVNVPGTTAQGVILDATETVPAFPIYTLRWLTEHGETITGTCGEGDLAAANNLTPGVGGGPASVAEIAARLRAKGVFKKRNKRKR